MDQKLEVTILRPDDALHRGFWQLYGDIIKELTSNLWLIKQLFKSDMSSYRQSLLGIYWMIIVPFLSLLAILTLQESHVFNIGSLQVPYPVYAIMGLAFWQIFSMGLMSATASLVNSRELILKVNCSRKAIVIASIGRAMIGFGIQIAVLYVLFLCYGIQPTPYFFLLPLMVLPLLLLTLSFGFILALLNCIIRDVGMGLGFLLTVSLLLTPVFYVKPAQGWLAHMTQFNLLYYLIDVPRSLVLTGSSSAITGYTVSTIVSFLLFVETLKLFHLTEHRIAEKI